MVFEGGEIIHEIPGELGVLLMMTGRSVRLWAGTPPDARPGLFSDHAVETRRDFLVRSRVEREIRPALETLAGVLERPTECKPRTIAYACVRIAHWARSRQAPQTADAFEHVADIVEPGIVSKMNREPSVDGLGEACFMLEFDDGAEPTHTIYHDGRWERARAALIGAPTAQQQILIPLFGLVESGWEHVRRLACLVEEHQGAPSDWLTKKLVLCVDTEVVEAYRTVALECRDLALDAHDGHGFIDDVEDEASRFDRNLFLVDLACSNPAVPARLRALIQSVAAHMEGWYPQVDAVLTLAEQIGPPFLPRDI